MEFLEEILLIKLIVCVYLGLDPVLENSLDPDSVNPVSNSLLESVIWWFLHVYYVRF